MSALNSSAVQSGDMWGPLNHMLELQDQMNTRVDANWKAANRDWYRACRMESFEIINHCGWEWWKSLPTFDIHQVHLEIVDIWHFLLSRGIETGRMELLMGAIPPVVISSDSVSPQQLILEAENFIEALFVSQGTFNSSVCKQFATLAAAAGLSKDRLYGLYLAKNTLNVFRQNNGYRKSGDSAYVKIWNGEEDNVWLVRIVDKLVETNSVSIENIMGGLQEAYNKVVVG